LDGKEVEIIFGSVGVSLLLLAFIVLLFLPMERVFPAKKQKIFRPKWFVDLCFFLGQYFIWGGIIYWALKHIWYFFQDVIPPEFREAVAAQPFWLQFIEVILLSDLLIYWGHRLQHNNKFLWRFHKVHHSAEHLDAIAAYREHPLDTIYTVGLINLPAIIMGFDLNAISGFIAFRGIWAVYIHSNVRFPIGPIRMLIGAPELHHWHHDMDKNAGNYANISPLMDILFGTYKCPDHEPEQFGIAEDFPTDWLSQMLHPILPKFISSKIWKPSPKPKQNESNQPQGKIE
jgi:sterol desaturase/sphingolipid hydroxylase (fatty acid hydroxylase superfamily)